VSDPKLEEIARKWLETFLLVDRVTPSRVRALEHLLAEVRREERAEWRDALFPNNSDTTLGREVMERGAKWAADVIAEGKKLAVGEERERAKRIVSDPDNNRLEILRRLREEKLRPSASTADVRFLVPSDSPLVKKR
jgi:hypothetical protein